MDSWMVGVLGLSAFAWWVWRQSNQIGAHNAELGVTSDDVNRVYPFTYLGGHPDLPDPIAACTLVFTPTELAIEKGPRMVRRIGFGQITQLLVETEEEATARVTATRLLLTGLFALAIKKKTPGTVLVTVETATGPFVFEKAKATKASVMVDMARPIAAVRRLHLPPPPVGG